MGALVGVREYECMWGEVLVCVMGDVGCVTMRRVGVSMLSGNARLWVSVLCACVDVHLVSESGSVLDMCVWTSEHDLVSTWCV